MVWTLFLKQQQRGAQIEPLPGKRRSREGEPRQPQQGETELEQDERGEDAEQTVDPQADAEFDEPGRLDRND